MLNGDAVNAIDISGKITSDNLSIGPGQLNTKQIDGSMSLPKYISIEKVWYGTTEEWNEKKDLVAKRGHIYVYSDTNLVKIGDGTSYLIDMPYTSGATPEKIKFWDNKVSIIEKDAIDETLTFTTGEI